MIYLGNYNLLIGRPFNEVGEWFKPVLEKGRGAAFVDTCFLRALIYARDPLHDVSAQAFERAERQNTNCYTTALVLAEAVRQIVKNGGGAVRESSLDKCTELVLDGGRVMVCSPPRDVVLDCYSELLRARKNVGPALDLCDLLSVTVLDHAHHRRVFGFDRHFSAFGAQLEPGP